MVYVSVKLPKRVSNFFFSRFRNIGRALVSIMWALRTSSTVDLLVGSTWSRPFIRFFASSEILLQMGSLKSKVPCNHLKHLETIGNKWKQFETTWKGHQYSNHMHRKRCPKQPVFKRRTFTNITKTVAVQKYSGRTFKMAACFPRVLSAQKGGYLFPQKHTHVCWVTATSWRQVFPF